MNRSWLSLLLLMSMCLLALAEDAAEQTKPLNYAPGKQIASLANRQIRESSGLTRGSVDGVLWTHNDSGNGPAVYAFDRKGRDLGRFTARGLANRDWEDMCTVPIGKQTLLLIADVGNNNLKEQTDTLYLLAEPKIDPAKPTKGGSTDLVMKIDFTFEGGPVNCEAVAYDPTDRSVIMFSKEAGFWCKAYSLTLPDKQPDQPLVAKKIADVELSVVTGADISLDGKRLVATTYRHAYQFVRGEKQTWGKVLADQVPSRVKLPARKQGESICYGRDGKTLYLTSEQTPCPLWELKVAE